MHANSQFIVQMAKGVGRELIVCMSIPQFTARLAQGCAQNDSCCYSKHNRVIRKVIGSFGVRYFRDSLYAVSLSVTGKYPKFAKIPHL